MGKGFGKPSKSKLDILAESAIHYCQQRSPEKLDSIFDYESPEFNHKICSKVIAALDIDTLSWFCSYLASEINYTEDNNKPHPIGELSGFLISLGFELFEDFTPYPGRRLVIANTEKFQSLPQEIQDKVNQFFIVKPTPSEESQEINDAILEKLETANLN
ncbi:hypothetical protein H6G06_17055 [Anabaena sphaerica FACHB-251]|uniref:Uncharacterized protein n=1 Tax=Anabaena sphaerica FACHB-251 TaxID=2692883 RepID=A0A926WIJ6_9NOST|nr:hypothetical protein [Anabaena sphaerica]MBD2295143.1 hypothetical protein [Anabaena sphaerica FACHB-251]